MSTETARTSEFITITQTFDGEQVDVVYKQARRPPDIGEGGDDEFAGNGYLGYCPPFQTRSYEAAPGIVCDQDQPVVLRDGTTIYTDIYRPDTDVPVPVILSWSFFGKRPGDGLTQWNVKGVPPETISLMAKFESVDPGYWCHHGYAVANVDPRGVGHSEGDISVHGSQDARDGYDFVEWVAEQPWCNGKVGMAGNSGVAVTQWAIAAQQPPHLACIAPWEGTFDLFNEAIYEGGVPGLTFHSILVDLLSGPNLVEDVGEMARRYPFFNNYWRDKVADFAKITVPAYITAGWSHIHLHGAFEGFRHAASTRKWIRAHRDFEWPDMYSPDNLEDLKRFYDRYLKDIHNGWELTPPVRLEVMDAFDCDYQVDRAEREFPLARTQYEKLYLDAASGSLSAHPIETESNTSYDAAEGLVTFDMTFEQDTELTGYLALRLFVEADGNDEIDLFVNIQKLSTTGEWLPTSVLGHPHPGAWGKIRASRRALDEAKSTDYHPVLAQQSEVKLRQDEIVALDVPIWPTSRIWHAGQQIRVQISGHYIREDWFEPLTWQTSNKGRHVLYTGGRHQSHLLIPVIPPRYRDGGYTYR
ncbi:CocE/NonD family hydrolase [Nocardia sp. NBC_01327]|uniref:CocE/NonD family hydrolase n=1 Tax=Nocardia sp. NBC_01327 TaxID=2903593 RepID=UPI002E11111A|nr:CocE/NonD family hydrolase [Nocardia sp. NBC_01327]